MTPQRHFGIFDYIVFFGTVGLSLFLGIYFGWKSRNKSNIDNYFLGNRKLSVIPTALSLAVTFQSSLMIIGIPAEAYAYGLKYAYYLIGSCSSYIFAGLIIVPVFHPLKLTSVNKYFKLRYQDNVVRYLVMSLGMFYYILYSGSVTFGTCVALEYLMGIPYWATIVMYSVVTAIYTSVGGMKAVVWTDVLQIAIMAMGVFAIIVKICMDVGGISQVFELASSRLEMNDFRLDPTIRYQFWNLTAGSFVGFLVTCLQQPGIQRINSTPTITSARRLYALAGVIYAVFALCVCFEGISIFAYFNNKGCDPLASGRIDTTNQLIPLAVADLFSTIPGLSGLFIAALSSAALSTLSSCLSSLGAVTYDDIIKEKYPNLSEQKATFISKIVVFLYGMLAMGFTAIIAVLPGTIINVTYALMGCVDGPTLAMFVVSMFYRKATTKGLVAGAFAGMLSILWLNIGAMTTSAMPSSILPSGQTDCCFNETDHSTNTSNVCVIDRHVYNNASEIYDTTNDNISPLQKFYSISFILYPLLGFVVSILVSVPVCWVTSPPKAFDERCLFNFRKHVLDELCGKRTKGDKMDMSSDSQDLELQEKLFV